MKKKGISLIILIITVIVLAILITITVTGIDDSVDISKEIALEEDLVNIKENIINKLRDDNNIANYTYPNIKLNKEELKSKINVSNTKKIDAFNKQVKLAKNYFYYRIDLSKIDAIKYKKGYGGKNGTDEEDFYYVEYNINDNSIKNIIYLKGYKIGEDYKFTIDTDVETVKNSATSLNIKIEDITNINKRNHKWANKITFIIENPQIASVKICDEDFTSKLDYKIENSELVIDKKIYELFNKNKLGIEFPSGEKQIIDVTNLDVVAPTITIKQDVDTVYLTGTDDKSGIKGYKYIEMNNLENLDSEYIDTFGKEVGPVDKIKLSSANMKIAIIAIDNAGNISAVAQ